MRTYRFKRTFLALTLAGFALIALAFRSAEPGGRLFEITKNLEIFINAYKELNTNYVDEIDPARFMRTGLTAMLESLDPYTNYISESDIEEYRFLSEGQYHGIGATYEVIDGTLTVTECYENSPATKAGIRPGDQILAVDGKAIGSKKEEDLNKILKGAPGTQIRLSIRRPGKPGEQEITLTRANVEVSNVPYAGMVSEKVGYIQLTTFTQGAAQNIQKALQGLKTEHPDMQGLILDLRNNGGGLLHEAVSICGIFLPKGELVVTTKGKIAESDRIYKTPADPADLNIPVAVLINKRSASASEIVSGTLQDLDRAVLVGQRSYGKGLVQNTYDIGYNSKLKLTTARYYIPSGRCIQSVQYKNGKHVDIADSLRTAFKTRNGRKVLDGGGVTPDIFMEDPEDNALMKALQDQHVIFRFVNQYLQKTDSISNLEAYTFTAFPDFEQFLKNIKFSYQSEADKALENLKQEAKKEKVSESLLSDLKSLENKLSARKATELQERKPYIISLIEREVAGRFGFERAKAKMQLRNDPEVEKAIGILMDGEGYKKILKK